MSVAAPPAPDYDVSMEATRVGFFETPVVFARMKSPGPLIDDLKAAIRARRTDDPQGIRRSNDGGWHSDTAMRQWGGAAAGRLVDQVIAVATRMTHFEEHAIDECRWRVEMWANVSGPGAINHLHVHPGSIWSAVFYVDAGTDEDDASDDVGGAFYFEDPRFPLAAMHTTAFRFIGADGEPQRWQPEVRPRAGDLIMFPAWLRHGVRAYRGTRERISIAINLDPKLS